MLQCGAQNDAVELRPLEIHIGNGSLDESESLDSEGTRAEVHPRPIESTDRREAGRDRVREADIEDARRGWRQMPSDPLPLDAPISG